MKKLLSLALALLMIAGSMVVGVSATEEPAVEAPAVEAPVAVGYQKTPVYVDEDYNHLYDIRFVATVGAHITEYAEVGFVITATETMHDGTQNSYSWTKSSNKAYENLLATTPNETVVTAVSASEYGATALIAMTITGIPANSSVEFTATPFMRGAEEVTLYGNAKDVTFAKGKVDAIRYPSTVSSDTAGAELCDGIYGDIKRSGGKGLLYQTNSKYTSTGSQTFYGFHIAYQLNTATNIDEIVLYLRNSDAVDQLLDVSIYGTNESSAYKALNKTGWESVTADWTELTKTSTATTSDTFVQTITLAPSENSYKYVWITFELAEGKRPALYEVEIWDVEK